MLVNHDGIMMNDVGGYGSVMYKIQLGSPAVQRSSGSPGRGVQMSEANSLGPNNFFFLIESSYLR